MDGALILDHAAFGGPANFDAGVVGNYFVVDAPQFKKNVSLVQLRYGSISNGEENLNDENTWRDLKKLFAKCEFSSGDATAFAVSALRRSFLMFEFKHQIRKIHRDLASKIRDALACGVVAAEPRAARSAASTQRRRKSGHSAAAEQTTISGAVATDMPRT